MINSVNYVRISRIENGDYIEIDERYVGLREGQNKILAFSIKAPIFETEMFERFFEGFNASEKLKINIAGTGSFTVSFRGIIDGKEKNYSKNIDHKILLTEETYCPTKKDFKYFKRVSKFMPRGYFD